MRHWTPEEDALIEAGYRAGERTSVIAERIGNGCTKNMVIGRARRLRLGISHPLCCTNRPPKPPKPPRAAKPPRARKPRQNVPSDPYERAAMYAAQFGCRAFTADEDALIRSMYANYVPTVDIAHSLGRLDNGKSPEGTVCQRIRQLGLHRSSSVFRMLRWAPTHLRPLAFTDEAAFIAQARAWREEQVALAKADKSTAKHERIAKALEQIEPTGMTRNQIICAKRDAGMTLQAIGDEYGMTRERVRQLAKRGPDWQPLKPHGRARKLDADDLRALVADGLDIKSIAETRGVHPTTVRNALRHDGIEKVRRRRPNFSEEEKEQIIEQVRDGHRVVDVAAFWGCTPAAIYHLRRRQTSLVTTPEYVARMWEQAGADLANA